MYHKKRLICTDLKGKIVGTVTLSGDAELKIEVSNCDADEIFLLSLGVERLYRLPTDDTFLYNEGKIVCALIKEGRVVGTSNGCEYNGLVGRIKSYKNSRSHPTIEHNTDCETSIPKNMEVEEIEEKEETSAEPPTQKDGITEKEIARFYCSIKSNLDETFTCYPTVEPLEKLIPYSRWVEIKKEDAPYVVGLIRDKETPRYVCYGVKSASGNIPPEDVRDYCQWLPLDEHQGYWIIFQDADTGDVLKEE